MISDRLTYLVHRLGTLSANELFWRLVSWTRHGAGRLLCVTPWAGLPERSHADLDRITVSRGSKSIPVAFDEALVGAIPERWWNDDSFWETLSQRYPEEAKLIVDRAQLVLLDTFRLFQWQEVRLDTPVRWSDTMEQDAPSALWPMDYYSTIGISYNPLHPSRDIKWCWELNRFQHLLLLGAAWRLTGEERFAAKAREHIESWTGEVRYPRGVQWNSNLEVGLRVLSWARCHILCRNSSSWDQPFLTRFLSGIHLHCTHLERELTVHHPPGNHLLGEASALFVLAVFYPLYRDSRRWRHRAVSILNDLVPRVILADGVYGEQTTGCFQFVAEFLLQVIHLSSRLEGEGLSSTVIERLASGMEFVCALAPDPADIPMVGDSDTGYAIGWQVSDFWDFRWLIAAGSVLLSRPRLAQRAGTFPLEAYLLLGEAGAERFTAMASEAAPVEESRSYSEMHAHPIGGYQISKDEMFNLIFDCGPLGLPPGHGHGHCDALSFILYFQGRPLFIDPGTFLYNGPAEWRNYFRSTAAHNTIRINGKEPSKPIGAFRWINGFRASGGPHVYGKDYRLLKGSLEWGTILHTRYILHLELRAILIIDHILGSGSHSLESSLHLDPAWQVRRSRKDTWTVHDEWDRIEIVRLSKEPSEPDLLYGSDNPRGGWYSRYYGQKIPTVTLRWSEQKDLPTVSVIGLKPSGTTVCAGFEDLCPDLPDAAVSLVRSRAFHHFFESGIQEDLL